MEVGAAVWVRDPGPETWVSGSVAKKVVAGDSVFDLEIELDAGGCATFRIAAGETEAADVKLRNHEDVSRVEDLITLPHLHEPALLHSLSERFNHGDIYTFTGPILIAANPFKRLPLYDEERLMKYFEYGLLEAQGLKTSVRPPPHVFAIADAAYRAMIESLRERALTEGFLGSQSILISGESGAGKTESTKFTMKYLTTVGAPTGMKADATDTVMQRVLQSNPILEAFGNARTIRNDNSSRFGKFIELHFDKKGHLIGAAIQTYLLEKVRLPNQALNERNFHIFYQLCAGANEAQRAEYRLGDVTEYYYTNQGQCFKLRQMDDKDEFRSTLKAMQVLQFSTEDVDAVLRISAGLLHLGQVAFRADKSEEGSEVGPDGYNVQALTNAAELLHVDRNYLVSVLTTRLMETRNESFTIKLKPQQALDARNAVAKGVYGRMFNWVVARINACIATDLRESRATVAILDIFGFESLKQNSFEQILINFTNETLQQQFNQFVFKMEQAEYEREKIEWSFISFPDNQDCLNLIEGKPNGILAMLDDECRLPKGSDEKLAARLQKDLASNDRFFVTKKMVVEKQFGVRHYAGEVAYNTAGFLDKNKDQLPKEATNLFLSSTNPFVQELFADLPSGPSAAGAGNRTAAKGLAHMRNSSLGSPVKAAPSSGTGMAAASVATQFKQQLQELMAKIHTTRPHYIRCIKPNDELVPDKFNRQRVTEQLRYGGVLEAVRVARSGYPVRLPHHDFFARYRCLGTVAIKTLVPVDGGKRRTNVKVLSFPKKLNPNDASETNRQWCEKLLEGILMVEAAEDNVEAHKVLPKDSVQLGKTKVFLRKVAHDVLEFKRISRLASAATKITSFFRAASIRREYVILRAATMYLQRIVRGHIARREAMSIRQEKAAKKLQTAYRAYHARHRYQRLHWAIVRLQCHYRGIQARKVAHELARERAAKRLLWWMRRACVCMKFRRRLRLALALQCGVRVVKARQVLYQLRREAKDVGVLKVENVGLKEEIKRLMAQVAKDKAAVLAEKERLQMEEERAAAAAAIEELERWKQMFAALEKQYSEEKCLREQYQSKAQDLQQVAAQKDMQLTQEKQAAIQAMEEVQRHRSHLASLNQRLEAEVKKRQQLEYELTVEPKAAPATGRRLSDPAMNVMPRIVPGAPEVRLAHVGHKILEAVSTPRHHQSNKSRPTSLDFSDSSAHARRRTASNTSTGQPSSLPPDVHDGAVLSPGGSLSTTAAGEVNTGQPSEQMASPRPLELSSPPPLYSTPGPEELAVMSELASSHELPDAGVGSAAVGASTTELNRSGDGSVISEEAPVQNGMGPHHDEPRQQPQQAAAPTSASAGPGSPGSPRRRTAGPPQSPARSHAASSSDSLMRKLSGSSSTMVQVSTPITPQRVLDVAHGRRFSDSDSEDEDLDRSVDLMDDEQEIYLTRKRERRHQVLERMKAQIAGFRETMVGVGLTVDVLELNKDGVNLSWVPKTQMRLPGATGADENLPNARLTWDVEKPKGGFLSGLFGASKPKPLEAPQHILISELYGISRGFRRVRVPYKVDAGDQFRIATLTTLQTPDRPRRAVLLRFEKVEQRNLFVDGIRRVWSALEDISNHAPPPSPRIAKHAISVRGYETGQVIPYETVVKLVAAERRETRMVFGQVLDLSLDVGTLEKESHMQHLELKRLEKEMDTKRQELVQVRIHAKELRAERLALLVKVNELTMENNEVVERERNMVHAMNMQFEQETDHFKRQLGDATQKFQEQLTVNDELNTKIISVQAAHEELKLAVDRERHENEQLRVTIKSLQRALETVQAQRGHTSGHELAASHSTGSQGSAGWFGMSPKR